MTSDPIENIKSFWKDRALNPNLAEENVTHPDRYQRFLEIRVLLQYLPRGQRILDIGCGNGFSTAIFSKYANQIIGVDYSASMVERAKKKFGQLPNVEFEVQNVLDLRFPSMSFDIVICQRCLINLVTWEAQQKAITEIFTVLKPGGCFFLQEGTCQGRERLNQVREILGLSRMPPVPYNLDFDEEKLWPFIRQYFEIVEVRRFGIYDLISRVLHPLLVRPEEPLYDSRINEIASEIAAKLPGVDELSREFSAFLRRIESR
jgi:ubiquinone/menaquinone biosynthesis C-methylase UbiE